VNIDIDADRAKPAGSEQGDNVLHVAFGVKQPGWLPKAPKSAYCNCVQHILVDEHERTVECAKCGKLLDAFEVLNSFAKNVQHWIDWGKHYRKEASAIEEEYEARKKERRRTEGLMRELRQDAEAMAELAAKVLRRLSRDDKRRAK